MSKNQTPTNVVVNHLEEKAGKTIDQDTMGFQKISHKKLGLNASVEIMRS